MIEIINLTKYYGKIKAVDDISFRAEDGEILGFLGPNGAGKSTTMNIITGYISSNSGTVKVCGHDILDEPYEVKKRIGYLPEQPPLYGDMKVLEFLKFICDLKSVDKKDRIKHLNDIMEVVKITDVQNRLIRNLSKGYKQRVGLAQALVGNPEVLILDEPTVGLDPKQIIEMRKVIKALGKEHTVILSSHILSEVSAVCDKVVIINRGKIMAAGKPEILSEGLGGAHRLSAKIDGAPTKILNLLKTIHGVTNVEIKPQAVDSVAEFLIDSDRETDIRKPIFNEMAKAGYAILEMKQLDMNLEEMFLQFTSPDKDINEGKVE